MAADSQNAIEGALGLGLFLLMLFGGVYFGPTVLRYVNKHWPKALTRSTKTRIIHDVHAPTTQESQREAAESSKKRSSLSSILSKSKSADGMVRPVSPSQQHNHRRLTQLQQLQLLSHSNSSTIVSSNKTNDVDRTSLELFFHTTHKSDSDWTSLEQGGNGRSNWLDRSKDIERWQGVTVGTVLTVREKEDVGRVIKLQLPKNNINGCLDALQPLTAILKISLWHNSIGGSLNGLRDMKKLQQLDLSKNSLTGTLEPLSGLSMLEELNLGYNNLEGTLDCISTLTHISRLVLCNNSFHGDLAGLEPIRTFQSIDLSHNPKLYGSLPANLHRRWISGTLPVNASGTGIGTDQNGVVIKHGSQSNGGIETKVVQFSPIVMDSATIDSHTHSPPLLSPMPFSSMRPGSPVGFKPGVSPSPQQLQLLHQILTNQQTAQRCSTAPSSLRLQTPQPISPLQPQSPYISSPRPQRNGYFTDSQLQLDIPRPSSMQSSSDRASSQGSSPNPSSQSSALTPHIKQRSVSSPVKTSSPSSPSSSFTRSFSFSKGGAPVSPSAKVSPQPLRPSTSPARAVSPSSSSPVPSPSRFPPASPKAQKTAERIVRRTSSKHVSQYLEVVDVGDECEEED